MKNSHIQDTLWTRALFEVMKTAEANEKDKVLFEEVDKFIIYLSHLPLQEFIERLHLTVSKADID